MKLIDLIATSETIDPVRNVVTYQTNVESGPGIILAADEKGEKDMIIINQIHKSGKVELLLKPCNRPAKKFKIGERVGVLLVLDGQE